MRIRHRSFVCIHKPWICFLWCTPMYIECFQCVIDKCYHYWLISKIFDMVSAGDGYAIVLHAIEFHTTIFHLNIWTYVQTSVIWICVHMNIHSFEKHMNNCSCIHPWLKCMLEHVNIWTLVHMWYMTLVVCNLIVRSCRIYHIENISQLTSGIWWCLFIVYKTYTYVHGYKQTQKSDKMHML